MVGRKIGRFLVLAKIGQGGMATVWKARDELLGREVALKILDEKLANDDKARRRFLHEARTAASLDHPGAVAVFDSGESEGIAYIAMRLVEGETLAERIDRSLLPIEEAIRIAIAVGEVLAQAHQRGVVHRDISCRNVMIGREGRVFVLDFGLALANWESRISSSGAMPGTFPYMAPEVLLGKDADVRADVYSLGVVLYEALTGSHPHPGEHPAASAFGALHGEPVPPRERREDVSEDLECVMLRAITRDPEMRFQTVDQLITQLRLAGQGAGSADPPKRRSPPHRPKDRDGIHTRPHPLYLSVLPFRVSGVNADPPLDALAARLTETLGCALAKRSEIHLVHGSPSTPATGDYDFKKVADELGANALLQGKLERAGSRLRVTYAVIDPSRGTRWGGGVVDGSIANPFDLEDEVVASVTSSLGLPATPAERRAASRPPDPAADERYAQALGYLRRYDNEASLDGAIRLLEQLISTEGDVAIYHAALTRAFLHKMDLTHVRLWESRAATACARAIELGPDEPEVHLAVGLLSSAGGRYPDALSKFSIVREHQRGWIEATLGAALAHLGSGAKEKALRAAESAVAASPEDWRTHSMLGWIHFVSGANLEAVDAFSRVTQLTPDNALGHLNLGNALYRLDRFDEAIEAYRRSISVHPYHLAYANLGTALYHVGKNEECITALTKATELNPADPIAWGNLGTACRWIGGHEVAAGEALDRAITLMRERLDRNPSFADGWGRLAAWLAERGSLPEAERMIRRALDLAPGDPSSMVRAGHVYFRLGDRKRCLEWLQKAVEAGYGKGELTRSREFSPLRDDPEFRQLVGINN
ncbi:MAG TPA: protein kinase [Candidatus Eisenbacteria bacterium]|nr:protein kinase [Candidatus Eisenbacteria bacterium]